MGVDLIVLDVIPSFRYISGRLGEVMIELRHICIAFIILIYALIVKLFGITDFKRPIQISASDVLGIFGKSIGVAVVEELVFRVLLFYLLFQKVLHLNFEMSMIFTSLIFAAGHFYCIGVHVHALHKIELFIGLFIFSMITCKNFPIGNIIFHMFAILGVEFTNKLFEQEEPRYWWVWDESHALIRSPIVWLVLIAYYFIV